MSEIKRGYGLGTIANHYEEHGHPLHSHVMPVFQTSSFGFHDMAEAEETFSGLNKEKQWLFFCCSASSNHHSGNAAPER